MTRRTVPRPLVYVTVDDGPSDDFGGKIEFLRSRGVPAVFFCTGERLLERSEPAIDAIRSGFLIANHSFSHPRFSTLAVDDAEREIALTDAVIENLYRLAGRTRPLKLFRFPYGDKGIGGGRWRLLRRDRDPRFRHIQRYLSGCGYTSPQVHRPRVPFPFVRRSLFRDVDSWWTFDAREWCLVEPDHPYTIRSAEDVITRFDRGLAANGWPTGTSDVLLLHDDVRTGHLFRLLIDRLIADRRTFALPATGPQNRR